MPIRRLWLIRLVAMIFVPLLLLGSRDWGFDWRVTAADFYFSARSNRWTFILCCRDSAIVFPPATQQPRLFGCRARAPARTGFSCSAKIQPAGDPDTTAGVGRYLEVFTARTIGTDFQSWALWQSWRLSSDTIPAIARECASIRMIVAYYMGIKWVGHGAETSYGLPWHNLHDRITILMVEPPGSAGCHGDPHD